MAINFIPVDRTKTLGNELHSLVTAFRSNHSKLKELKDIMDSMTDNVDFTNIESQFGLPTGKGQAVYDLIVGDLAELNGSPNFKRMNDRIVPLV